MSGSQSRLIKKGLAVIAMGVFGMWLPSAHADVGAVGHDHGCDEVHCMADINGCDEGHSQFVCKMQCHATAAAICRVDAAQCEPGEVGYYCVTWPDPG